MAENWSEAEVEAVVEDYFSMLREELAGKKYNKTRHRETLKELLNNRSDGSVELKHQNISAVLIEMGIQYIDGYKPRYNYQKSLLPSVVSVFLMNNPELHSLFQADSQHVPEPPTVADFLAVLEDPPKREDVERTGVSEPKMLYNPSGVNYLESEARNQMLGDAGEEFVLNFERARLIHAGKHGLADRIEQVSVTVGPAAGYDIRSFEKDGTDRYIEAKTTKYGKNTPFFITPNELEFSRDNASRYFLYRLFKFRNNPGMFSLRGHLQDKCTIKPSQFIAKPT